MRAIQEEGEVVAATGDGPFLLNGKWVLWFDGALSSGRRSQANDWAKNMKRIGDFASVEEFWGIVNFVPPPSKLPVGCNYHLFREGIMPMWEDGNNATGGGCTYNEKRKEGTSSRSIDNMWLWTMLSLIGEQYPEPAQICGGVCSLRGKQDRVSVWTRDGEDEKKWMPVKSKFKDVLEQACRLIETAKTINDRDVDFSPHKEQVKKALTGGKRR